MIDFKGLFELDSKNNKINQINNLLVGGFDVFTDAILETENSYREKIELSKKELPMLEKRLSNYTDENKGVPTEADYKILEQLNENHSVIYLSTEHLTALAEMKIVYLFKSLEISMKSLVQIAYPKVNTRDFYKWENMVTFFKSRDIDISRISKINGVEEADDLRMVNNIIKHSNTKSDKLKSIKEFASKNDFDAYSIDLFYLRIKSKIEVFFKELTEYVIDNLYNYNEQRIDNICNEYAGKMDKKTLELFIEKLKRKTQK